MPFSNPSRFCMEQNLTHPCTQFYIFKEKRNKKIVQNKIQIINYNKKNKQKKDKFKQIYYL